MKRTGRKRRPCYRISVADRAFPRDGRTLETLGIYDPASPKPELRLTLKADVARRWLMRGAQPSDTVASIFRREGVYEDFPAKKRRKRTGRKQGKVRTQTQQHKQKAKEEREAKKTTRRTERVAAKRAAMAAAASAEESE